LKKDVAEVKDLAEEKLESIEILLV